MLSGGGSGQAENSKSNLHPGTRVSGGWGCEAGVGGWVPPTNASLPHDPGHSDEEHHTPNVQHAAYLWKGRGGDLEGGGAKQCSVHLSSVVH